MLGNSLFWSSAAVLRLLLVAWAPAVLATHNATDVADLTLFLALGIVGGALVVPRLIPIEKLRRARLAAYAMGVCILAFGFVATAWPARIVLVAIGLCGGLFMVPMNAALQEIGHKSTAAAGSGASELLREFRDANCRRRVHGTVGWARRPGPAILVVGTSVDRDVRRVGHYAGSSRDGEDDTDRGRGIAHASLAAVLDQPPRAGNENGRAYATRAVTG
jgi:hypothetical protein